jgi:hypothetical protein
MSNYKHYFINHLKFLLQINHFATLYPVIIMLRTYIPTYFVSLDKTGYQHPGAEETTFSHPKDTFSVPVCWTLNLPLSQQTLLNALSRSNNRLGSCASSYLNNTPVRPRCGSKHTRYKFYLRFMMSNCEQCGKSISECTLRYLPSIFDYAIPINNHVTFKNRVKFNQL